MRELILKMEAEIQRLKWLTAFGSFQTRRDVPPSRWKENSGRTNYAYRQAIQTAGNGLMKGPIPPTMHVFHLQVMSPHLAASSP